MLRDIRRQVTVSLVIQDPITDEAAVLVKRYNITQGKELELELAKQKLALQR